MPISSDQITQLETNAQGIVDGIAALVADLNAANATIAQLTNDNTALLAKINAARAAAQADKDADDASEAGQGVLNALA